MREEIRESLKVCVQEAVDTNVYKLFLVKQLKKTSKAMYVLENNGLSCAQVSKIQN